MFKLTQQGLLLVEGAAAHTHLLVKCVEELVARQHRTQNTHTHALCSTEGKETMAHLYLVLLCVGVIFPNPGGPCCPLSEENLLMMPSKPHRHVRNVTLDLLTPRDPRHLSISLLCNCYFFGHGGNLEAYQVHSFAPSTAGQSKRWKESTELR